MAIMVAILAGVAIPIYIGYVNDSAQNILNNEASGLSAAVTSAVNYGTNLATYANNTIIWPKANFPTPLNSDIVYIMSSDVTADANLTTANLVKTGVKCVLSLRSKTATASW